MNSRPMNTATSDSTDCPRTGRRMKRWINTPMANEIAIVRKNATQYGRPALIRLHAM